MFFLTPNQQCQSTEGTRVRPKTQNYTRHHIVQYRIITHGDAITHTHRASFRVTPFLVHVTWVSGGTTRQRNVIGWPTFTDSDWL